MAELGLGCRWDIGGSRRPRACVFRAFAIAGSARGRGRIAADRHLLRENQAVLKELQAEPFAEKDSGILESYLAKIRRDGLPKHADMKQRAR